MSIEKKVLIVDDHPLFREGLKSLIDRSPNYGTVGEAGNSEEALHLAEELQPDMVTMDVSMPGDNGVTTAGKLLRAAPGVKVLMVSMHPRYEYVAEAFRAGARGYLVKEATGPRLIEALDALGRGEFFIDGNVSRDVVGKLMADATSKEDESEDEAYNLLTPREQQVMRLVVEDVTAREIARRLSLKQKTVENHRANLMKKLGVHSKMELVRYAARLGLIDLDSWKN